MSLGAGPFQQPGEGLVLGDHDLSPHPHPPNLTWLRTEQVASPVLETQVHWGLRGFPAGPLTLPLLTNWTLFPPLLLGCQGDTYLSHYRKIGTLPETSQVILQNPTGR